MKITHIAIFSILLLFISVTITSPAFSAESFTRDAKIMEIDLPNNVIVVGEKYIHLQSRGTGSTKTWSTKFISSSGATVNPKTLFVGQPVVANGDILDNGDWVADEVTVMDEEKQETTDKVQDTANSEIKLEDGVWSN